MKIKENGKIFSLTDKEFFVHLKELYTSYPNGEDDLCRILNSDGGMILYEYDLEDERWILTYDDELLK
jgi:hypothetical protein